MKPRRPISYETNLPPQNHEPENPGSLAARFAAMLKENLKDEKHEKAVFDNLASRTPEILLGIHAGTHPPAVHPMRTLGKNRADELQAPYAE